MIKTAFAAALAFALTSGAALAQDAPGTLKPTTTPQGDTTVTSSSSAAAQSTAMPATVAAPAPTILANTPAGDAPSTYPKCTHKGQDRCISMARR